MRRAITASSAPFYKPFDRENLLFELDAMIHAVDPPAQAAPEEPKERDPAAAAEYFRSLGYRVVQSS